MSIFSKIRPFSKSHRPATTVQPVRDAARTIKVWVGGDKVFRLTQDPNALERDGGYEFTLHWTSGTETDSKGFDSESEADLYAWHLATPLPETSGYADEPPVLPDAAYFEPAPEDVAWLNSVEQESDLDQWLDTLAPEDYDALGMMEGGAGW